MVNCSLCNKNYSSQRSYLNHRRRFHEMFFIDKDRRRDQTNGCYNCKYCKKEYKIAQSRWYHEKVCKAATNTIIPPPSQSPIAETKCERERTFIILSPQYCNVCENNNISNNNIPKTKPKRTSIPSTIKRMVWNKYIGECIGKTKCYCCKLSDITQLSFHCGHVIAESNGGGIEVENLRPICQNCNSSMRTTNMEEFIEKYKIHHQS